MATNEDLGDDLNAIEIKDSHAKHHFLSQQQLKQKELGKRQRQYKKILNLRYKSRNDTIVEKSYNRTIGRMRHERNDLRAQIWVANGVTYVKENVRFSEEIQCHIKCQEELTKRIKTLKKDISNMERGIQHISKQIYELNRKTVPDTQHQAHVADARKKLSILENRLEVGTRQESVFTAANAALREKINNILFERRYFYETYSKMMQSLNRDKKYLSELMESALNVFENCIDAQDKIELVNRRIHKEKDTRKFEAQSLMRNVAASQETEIFVNTKSKSRILADLQPKEVRRRRDFMHNCDHKINLYNDILIKLLHYSDAHDVSEVKERFQQQESLYYSYFSYANEVGYHVTLLNNSVNRLYSDVEILKNSQKTNFSDQINTIEQLEAELQEKKKRNAKLKAMKETKEHILTNLLNNMNNIVKACNVNTLPLMDILGDNRHVNMENVCRFAKALENRVINIVASVYCHERLDPNNKYVIGDIEKTRDIPTDLRHIVLTQQCPECAEGEAYNMDDMADSSVRVLTVDEAKRRLFDKVNQPEMQYRLHNISQCRLPRSRILAAKRNG